MTKVEKKRRYMREWRQKNREHCNRKAMESYYRNWENIRTKRNRMRKKNRHKINLARRQAYAANPEKFLKEGREWRRLNPEQHRFHKLKQMYGVSKEEVLHRVEEQGGRCAICRSKFIALKFHLDHNHRTGEARGLLCAGCNVGLGRFRDDPKVLARAVFYLKAHK